jgi:hypothetical protein
MVLVIHWAAFERPIYDEIHNSETPSSSVVLSSFTSPLSVRAFSGHCLLNGKSLTDAFPA